MGRNKLRIFHLYSSYIQYIYKSYRFVKSNKSKYGSSWKDRYKMSISEDDHLSKEIDLPIQENRELMLIDPLLSFKEFLFFIVPIELPFNLIKDHKKKSYRKLRMSGDES